MEIARSPAGTQPCTVGEPVHEPQPRPRLVRGAHRVVDEPGGQPDVAHGVYTIHPALPWYFTSLFHQHHPGPAGEAATHAYTAALADLGRYYHRQVQEDGYEEAVDLLAVEEANLLHARRLARTHHQWGQLIATMQGLDDLYERQGRTAESARLVEEVTPYLADPTPYLADPTTDRPLPGRHDQWAFLTGFRIRLAFDGRDWPTATRLLTLATDHDRQAAADALAADPTSLDDDGRNRIRNLAIDYERLGRVQRKQRRQGHYRAASGLLASQSTATSGVPA